MFETYNTSRHEVMAVTSMQALKLHKPPAEDRRQTQDGVETQGSAGQGLTMGQAEKLLKSLVEEGWFEKSAKGYYSLSPRTLMELRGWLMETYNDVDDQEEEDEAASKKIKQCFACKDIITTARIIYLHANSPANQIYRVNDVRRRHAHADYMIYARRTSSVLKSRENARCVRPIGQAKTTWANEQLYRRNPRQERVARVQLLDRSRQSPLRTRMRLVPMKMNSKMRTIEQIHDHVYILFIFSRQSPHALHIASMQTTESSTLKSLPLMQSLGGRQQSLLPARRTRF